jgi:hypothetical protein
MQGLRMNGGQEGEGSLRVRVRVYPRLIESHFEPQTKKCFLLLMRRSQDLQLG